MQQPSNHHLAQLNVGRIRYEIDDPRMTDFTNNLAVVNGIAERSAGFVWRYIDQSGNATNTRPYADPLSHCQFFGLGEHRCTRALCLANNP